MNELIIYESENGVQVEVRFDGETIWATQRQISELFETTPQNITLHLKKVYAENEIEKKATCKEYLQVQIEGVVYCSSTPFLISLFVSKIPR